MLEPWQFLIVALAAFRLTRFFVLDSLIGGNLDSKSRFSKRLDSWAYNAHGQRRSDIPTVRAFWHEKVGDLLTCTYCLGFWITVVVWAAWSYGPEWGRYVVFVFALAGVQALLNHFDRR